MSDKKWPDHKDDEPITENQGFIPAWFSILFAVTVVIGIAYGVLYHFGYGWSQSREYATEIEHYAKEHPVVHASLDADGKNPYRGDQTAIAAGEKTFSGICAACHKADGTGLVGPNLVDAKWLHGGNDNAIFAVIMEGVDVSKLKQKPAMGPMPAHKNSLGARKVLEVMAFLASKNPELKAK